MMGGVKAQPACKSGDMSEVNAAKKELKRNCRNTVARTRTLIMCCMLFPGIQS